jgi:hypothetical protein
MQVQSIQFAFVGAQPFVSCASIQSCSGQTRDASNCSAIPDVYKIGEKEAQAAGSNISLVEAADGL